MLNMRVGRGGEKKGSSWMVSLGYMCTYTSEVYTRGREGHPRGWVGEGDFVKGGGVL